MRYNRNPIKNLQKVVPLLMSYDESQIRNALALLETMMDVFPSEVDQIWRQIPKDVQIETWAHYLRSRYLLDPSIRIDPIFKDGAILFYVKKYVKGGKNFFLNMGFGTELWLLNVATYAWITIPTDTYEKETTYQQMLKLEDIPPQLLGVDMHKFDSKSFVDVMTVLNSPFTQDAFAEFKAVLP